jgi:hypothetical protein
MKDTDESGPFLLDCDLRLIEPLRCRPAILFKQSAAAIVRARYSESKSLF